jgi:hypothetical protein
MQFPDIDCTQSQHNFEARILRNQKLLFIGHGAEWLDTFCILNAQLDNRASNSTSTFTETLHCPALVGGG